MRARKILCLYGATLLLVSQPLAAQAQNPLEALKRAAEKKAEELRRKAECAVNNKACAEEPKSDSNPGTPETPSAPGQPSSPGAAATPSAAGRPLDARFQSTPLAPTAAALGFENAFSDDGVRVAGVAMKGSRFAVVIDGQEGPVFDQIGTLGGRPGIAGKAPAEFSRNGKRVAYVGKRGGKEIAVIDGKEDTPYMQILGAWTPGAHARGTFLFSDDGSRVAYVARFSNTALQVVLDGTASGVYGHVEQCQFAGNRLACVVRDVPSKVRNPASWHVLVDGKEGPPYVAISSLQGNKDGHVAYIGNKGDSWAVVVDGKEIKEHSRYGEQYAGSSGALVLAPRTARVAYPVSLGAQSQLVVDGAVVATAPSILQIVFSPDATRIAAVVAEAADGGFRRGWRVISDGWTSQVYADIGTGADTTLYGSAVVFSPDSRRLAFIGRNNVHAFAVVDGQESSAFHKIQNFQFSPDSRRYAFEAFLDGKFSVVIDGLEGPKLQSYADRSLTFSPEGSRVAYGGTTTTVMEHRVVADGQELKAAAGAFQPRLPKGNWKKQSFVFSHDGKRLAYVDATQDPTGKTAVIVDGRTETRGHAFMLPTFSPDGKRFAYFSWSDGKSFLVVDGKAAPVEGDLFEAPRSLAFQEDGSLRFLVVKDGMVHRVVVTP